MKSKVCSRCGIEQPLSKFHKRKRGKDGYTTRCKKCLSIDQKASRSRFTGEVTKSQKTCSDCKETKPASAFSKVRSSSDGLCRLCRQCRSKKRRTTVTEILPPGMKRCSKCKQVLPFSMFTKDRSHSDGLGSQCKTCRSKVKPKEELPEGMKRCFKCKEVLPLAQFYKSKARKHGYTAWCKSCILASQKEERQHRIQNQSYVQKSEKLCPKCGVTKPVSEFHSNRQAYDGLAPYCRECQAVYDKVLRQKRIQEQNYLQRTEKTCSICGVTKLINEFHQDRTHPDGHRSCCTTCAKQKSKERWQVTKNDEELHKKATEAKRRYRKKYAEEIRRKQREWTRQNYQRRRANWRRYVERHREEVRQRGLAWYYRNAESESKKAKVYYQNNKGKIKQRHAKYRKNNKEKTRKRHQKYNREHRKENLNRSRKHRAANRDLYNMYANRRRVLTLNAPGFHTVDEWNMVKRAFNYTCPKCGRGELEIKLTRDHIVPLTVDGTSDDIFNIQPLCQSCNSSKSTQTINYYTQAILNKLMKLLNTLST